MAARIGPGAGALPYLKSIMFCRSTPQTFIATVHEPSESAPAIQLPLCLEHAYILGARIRAGVLTGFDLYEGLIEFDPHIICAWELDWPACEE